MIYILIFLIDKIVLQIYSYS